MNQDTLPKNARFVLAFPQADLREDIWMKLPIVFHVDGQTEANSDRHYVLKLKKSLSGLKQAIFQILKADDQIPILTMQKMLCQELEW